MKRKFLALILAALCAATSSVCFAACNFGITPHEHTYFTEYDFDEDYHWHNANCKHTGETTTKQPHSFTGDVCNVCGYTKSKPSLTLEEFVANHKQTACNFVETYITPEVYGDKDVITQSYSIQANDSGELTKVNLFFTYMLLGTNRAIDYVTVTLNNPLDFNKIVDGTAVLLNDEFTTESETVFTFNLKENRLNQDLATALYNSAKVNSDIMLFKDAKLSSPTRSQYGILNITDSNVEVTYVTGDSGDSKEEFINNLSKDNVRIFKSETKLDGAILRAEKYELDNFINKTENTDMDTVEVFNDALLHQVLLQIFPRFEAKQENITFANWYVTGDINGKISQLEYSFRYNHTSYNYGRPVYSVYYRITKITFETPVSLEEIKLKRFRATYEEAFAFDCNRNNSQDDIDFADAVCNKVYKETLAYTCSMVRLTDYYNEEEQCYYNSYSIHKSDEYGARELDIYIKNAATNAELLEMLNDENNYVKVIEYSYEVSGKLI